MTESEIQPVPTRVIFSKPFATDEVWADVVIEYNLGSTLYQVAYLVDEALPGDRMATSWATGDCFSSYLRGCSILSGERAWKFCLPGTSDILPPGTIMDNYLSDSSEGDKELRLIAIKQSTDD